MKESNEVPLEGVLKWIARERDRLQEKLDYITPYTKSLEKKIWDMEQEKEKHESELLKKAEQKIKVLEAERQQYLAELNAFREDYRQTQWFIQMDEDRKKIRKENKALRKALSSFLSGQNLNDEDE